MRSVTVVLPASIWAMMPMFRVRSSGTSRTTISDPLPLEVAEGAVGLGHLVRVLAPLDGGTQTIHRVHELEGELLAHRLAAAPARGLDQPADAQRHAPVAADLHRHLVGGATDAARLDLDERRGVAQRGLEHLEAGT